jgi:hypothetical protein
MIKPQDSLAMVMHPKKPEQRVLAIALAAVAVVGLAFATVSHQWIYNPASVDGEYGFGPTGMFHCTPTMGTHGLEERCEHMSNAALIADWRERDAQEQRDLETLTARGASQREIGEAEVAAKRFHEEHVASSAFPIVGWLAFVGCLIAALSLASALVLVALKKRPHVPILPTTTALLGIMLAIVTGCLFVATKPGGAGFVGVGIGFWAYGIGCVLGIGSTLMLNRSLRPVDDDLAEPMDADQF